MKNIEVHFSEIASSEYQELQKQVLIDKEKGKLNSTNIQLLNAIEREKNNLKIDPHCGTHIPRRNISKAVHKKIPD